MTKYFRLMLSAASALAASAAMDRAEFRAIGGTGIGPQSKRSAKQRNKFPARQRAKSNKR